MMRRMISTKALLLVPCALALGFGLAACGGDDSSSSSTTRPSATSTSTTSSSATSSSASSQTTAGASKSAGVVVTIQNFAFKSNPVQAGQSFQVENKDSTEHTFTADDGAFDVDVPAGKTVTVDGQTAGTYKYHCKIHSFMHGTLEVS
jgi:plastocyanin